MSRVRVPDGVPSLGANENCAQRNPLTGGTKYSKVLDASQIRIVGVFNGEGPPVPIPNTEVKLTSADNTCLETDREDRSMPTQRIRFIADPLPYASLAQQVEHAAVNRRVVGSNPTGGAKRGCRHLGGGIFRIMGL